jgi:hypothetical protein
MEPIFHRSRTKLRTVRICRGHRVSGSGEVTLSSDTTLHVYAFGYDSEPARRCIAATRHVSAGTRGR